MHRIESDPHFADYAEPGPVIPKQTRRLDYNKCFVWAVVIVGCCAFWMLVSVFVWHGSLSPR